MKKLKKGLRVLKKKGVVLSELEKRKVCESFDTSGLTLLSFCQREGVSKTALYNWRKKFGKLKVKESVSNFVQLRPSGKATELSGLLMLELKLLNGVLLRLSLSEASAVHFIKELSYASAIVR